MPTLSTMGWFLIDMPGEQHVVPQDDLHPHTLHHCCPCCPREDDESADLWVHSSFDGRERHENGMPLH